MHAPVDPFQIFQVAFWCFGMHIVSTVSLSWQIGDDLALSDKLFGRPAWAGKSRGFMALLNLRYFWPFTESPNEIYERTWYNIATFWAARLTGAAFPLFMLLFFVDAFLFVGQ